MPKVAGLRQRSAGAHSSDAIAPAGYHFICYRSHILELDRQVELAEELVKAGADIIQTEGTSSTRLMLERLD